MPADLQQALGAMQAQTGKKIVSVLPLQPATANNISEETPADRGAPPGELRKLAGQLNALAATSDGAIVFYRIIPDWARTKRAGLYPVEPTFAELVHRVVFSFTPAQEKKHKELNGVPVEELSLQQLADMKQLLTFGISFWKDRQQREAEIDKAFKTPGARLHTGAGTTLFVYDRGQPLVKFNLNGSEEPMVTAIEAPRHEGNSYDWTTLPRLIEPVHSIKDVDAERVLNFGQQGVVWSLQDLMADLVRQGVPAIKVADEVKDTRVYLQGDGWKLGELMNMLGVATGSQLNRTGTTYFLGYSAVHDKVAGTIMMLERHRKIIERLRQRFTPTRDKEWYRAVIAPIQLSRYVDSQFVPWERLTPEERKFISKAAPQLPRPQEREVWFLSQIQVAINDADDECLQCSAFVAAPNSPSLPVRRLAGSQWVPWSGTDGYLKLGARVVPPAVGPEPEPVQLTIPVR